MKTYLLLISSVLLIPSFVFAQDFFEYASYESGNIPIQLKNKNGLKNSKNEIIVPAIYHNVSDFSEGLFKVELNDKVGFIDSNGKFVIPLMYDVDNENIIGQYLYIKIEHDNNGDVSKETLIKSINNEYTNFTDGLCAVVKDKKYGYINKKNKIIIPLIYEAADNFHEELAVVKLDNKYGLINKKGKIVLVNKYDSLIWDQNFSVLLASQNGEFFYIERDLKTIKKLSDQ